ncbi:hypothetical protein [Myroides fluvii]|uniref:hypothetical protein n=1 Tax=Myroides fluvii TaxID=2572594 RepID=UPI00131E3EDF|nr:hypothetical protein [Myroides fluvii]
MKIGKPFRTLTLKEYLFYIDNHNKYTDFNTLGLYRSLVEHERLTLEEKLELRAYAHRFFKKPFDFLQLKDPKTYVEVAYLGQELTAGDEQQIWRDVKRNQHQILKDKRIKHRNFGDYSKHNCGDEACIWYGLMVRQGSWLAEGNMHFNTDIDKYNQKQQADRIKSERKNERNLINKAIQDEQE